ncbi:MAG: hypothetical protein K8S94_01495 [Planctomycetia bacterium]|nr:hypothetical protein [Planctomycetia bacterium]
MPGPNDHPLNRKATSREQVSRIDRSYFHQLSPLQHRRRWLIGAAVAFGIGWCAWGAIDVPRHHSPGPVATVHAKWENDCNACHVPLSPIKDNTWLTTANTRREMEAKCEACHRAASHHPLQVAAEVGSCASCHADHRGRSNDLVRVADHSCTDCHANIAAHRIASADVAPSGVTTPITRFDNEHHPPFASLASDPGTVKFSHGRHMRAGLTFASASDHPEDRKLKPYTRRAAQVWTYGLLAEKDRGRYLPAGGHDDDLVQLSCNSCHEFASTAAPEDLRTVSSLLTASSPGAYALPVDFDRHCAACHVLPYDGTAVPEGGVAAADTALERTAAGPRSEHFVPHGLDAAGLRRFLESTFLEEALEGNQDLLNTRIKTTSPLPAVRTKAVPDETLRKAIVDRVRAARTFVQGTCDKCHTLDATSIPSDGSLLEEAEAEALVSTNWFRVLPSKVPDVWLSKARFDHHPHRSYDCRLCHAAAYPDDPAAEGTGITSYGSPLDNEVVMIAGRESCTQCHAPSRFDAATRTTVGGARFDCVECHGYHGLGPHGPH